MLGGGIFTAQNKVIPGAYINFVSAAQTGVDLSGRGVAAIPLSMSWGPEGTVIKITAEEFRRDSLELLGYPMESREMLPFRELFKNALTVYYYRLNNGAVKAENTFGTAKYSGVRGNSLRLTVQKNADDETKYDVKTYLEAVMVDRQTISAASELSDNEFVVFKKDAEFAETAGMEMEGGSDGGSVSGQDYQDFLDKIQTFSYHVLACDTTDSSTKNLFTAFTKRMRDDMGIKFQTVLYRDSLADFEGVISVENRCAEKESGLVYWSAGAAAGCAVNGSNTNKRYDGEYTVDTAYKQSQLEDGIRSGKFLFHQVGDEVRVLADVNTFVSHNDEKSGDFSENQTIRLLDQVGNDIAAIFNGKYLGAVPNNASGRVSFWDDVVTYNKKLIKMNAVEAIESEQIKVSAGKTKRAVVIEYPIKPTNCMTLLYMTVIVQ